MSFPIAEKLLQEVETTCLFWNMWKKEVYFQKPVFSMISKFYWYCYRNKFFKRAELTLSDALAMEVRKPSSTLQKKLFFSCPMRFKLISFFHSYNTLLFSIGTWNMALAQPAFHCLTCCSMCLSSLLQSQLWLFPLLRALKPHSCTPKPSLMFWMCFLSQMGQ